MVGICNDLELRRIRENILQLSEDLQTIQSDDLFGPGNFNVDEFCLESRLVQEEFTPTAAVDISNVKHIDKPRNGHLEYNGNDSDLDNSESGVSSMESLESLLKKSETNETPEVFEQLNENSDGIEQNESPGKTEKVVEEAAISNQLSRKETENEADSATSKIEVPVLILTDENGVVYSDKTDAGSPVDDEPLTFSYSSDEADDNKETREEISKVDGKETTSDETDETDARSCDNNIDNVDSNQSPDPLIENEVESESVKLPEVNNNKNNPSETAGDTDKQQPLDSSGNHENLTTEAQPSSNLPTVDDRISIESSSHRSILNSPPVDHGQTDSNDYSNLSLEKTDDANDSKKGLNNSEANVSSDLDDESLAKLAYIPLKSEFDTTNGLNPTQLDVTGIERTTSAASSHVSMEVQLSDDGRSPSYNLPKNDLVGLLNKEDQANGETSENPHSLVNGDHDKDSSNILKELRKLSGPKRTENLPAPQRTIGLMSHDSSSYQSPYFQEALERLRELNDDEVPLKDGMSLDVFVVEVEKLLEKLRVIEDMMRAGQGVPDSVKDELARHVVRL